MNSLLLGQEQSFKMLYAFHRHHLLWRALMEESEEPVMRWAVFTTLCSALRSETEQLPYHNVTLLVRMLSMVQW